MDARIILHRPWEIWLVQHSHVDIGYTEPQGIVKLKHAEFIAQALDACTATDRLAPGERFCWTCEVSWTVKAFLARYPERAEEFFRRVREGRIEVTALYVQLTDLFTLDLLEETSDYALKLGRNHGFEVVTAMNDDVNGWAWGLPDLLSSRGVRYMDTAINETRSLGVRPRPSLLRWTGPEGGSLHFWHSDGYLHGNSLGLDRPGAERRVLEYLERLENRGYPHDKVEVRIQGEAHDNAPPGLWLSQVVQDWNTRYDSPKLRLVTPRQWFGEAEEHWPGSLNEYRAGWPDWWADGNGSAAVESSLVRSAQADLATYRSLVAVTGRPASAEQVESARDAAVFFCEHTWGAWCSTDDPSCLSSRAQWNVKAGFAYSAAVEARALVQEGLADEARRIVDDGPAILVFNPTGQTRSDLVELLVADADLGLDVEPWVMTPQRTKPGPSLHLVDMATQEAVPVHREPCIADSARRPAQTLRFLARDVPARGFRTFNVQPGETRVDPRSAIHGEVLTSPALEVMLAPSMHGISAIRSRISGDSWVLAESGYALGEVVYETIPGSRGRESLCGWDGIRRDARLERARIRFALDATKVLPYGCSMSLVATDLPGSLRSLALDIVVYDELPRVDLSYRLDKNPHDGAEALYVAFPLAVGSNPEVWLDVPGAVLRPGRDQVPGTATDWHSVQHYFAVSGEARTLVVSSPDVPLVQVNGINTGLWQRNVPPPNGVVMSWVMNNYWFTNFPASQGGGFTWRYCLQGMTGPFDRTEAERFALASRQPMRATLTGMGRPGFKVGSFYSVP